MSRQPTLHWTTSCLTPLSSYLLVIWPGTARRWRLTVEGWFQGRPFQAFPMAHARVTDERQPLHEPRCVRKRPSSHQVARRADLVGGPMRRDQTLSLANAAVNVECVRCWDRRQAWFSGARPLCSKDIPNGHGRQHGGMAHGVLIKKILRGSTPRHPQQQIASASI